MNLQGRVAIVSGGARGIGQGIALALAKAGSDVAINYRRDDAAAKETVSQIEALGRRGRVFKADIADYEEVKKRWRVCDRQSPRFDFSCGQERFLVVYF